MTIGELIRQKMKEHKKTQANVARAVGLDRTTISKYINGKIDMPEDVFKKIATAVNSPVLIKKAFGTTQCNVVFDIDYNNFYEILHRVKVELKELIDEIDNVMLHCHNTNHKNNMPEEKIEMMKKMLDQNASTNNACDILDIACDVRGFSLQDRNRRWRQRCEKEYNLIENRRKKREVTYV